MAILRLRRTLDLGGVRGASVLQTVANGYLLTVRADELDAEVFQTRVEDGRRVLAAGDTRRARAVFIEALAYGVVPRWPTSPTSSSHSPRSGALRSCDYRPSRHGSTATSSSVSTPP
jgi:hypothetical protein